MFSPKKINIFLIFVLAIIIVSPAKAAIISETHPLKRKGINLFLQQHHEESIPLNSPHILLIHGLTYSSHEFDVNYQDYSLVRFFVNNGFNVWIIDITGYGRSGNPENGFLPDSDYAAQDIAEAVKYIRKIENIEKINLLGWSWGTITASRMAAAYPKWINKIILYAPIHRGLGSHPVPSAWHKNTWVHAADDFQKLPSGAIDFSTADRAVVATYLSNCWKYDQDRSPNGGRSDLLQGEEINLFDEKKLTMPVLLIGGTKAPYLNWNDLELVFKNLPQKNNSKTLKIDGASHVMMLEKEYYRRFQKEVLDFLRE